MNDIPETETEAADAVLTPAATAVKFRCKVIAETFDIGPKARVGKGFICSLPAPEAEALSKLQPPPIKILGV